MYILFLEAEKGRCDISELLNKRGGEMKSIPDENQTIMDLVFKLESEIASVNLKVITLNDIRTLMGRLRDDMDNVNEKEIRIYFMDYHRSIRVLDELIWHTVNDLNKANEKLYELHQYLFDKVVKGKEV